MTDEEEGHTGVSNMIYNLPLDAGRGSTVIQAERRTPCF
jgi:hypothetical protein